MSVNVGMLPFSLDRATLLVEPAPKDGDAVEHLARASDERVLVDCLLRAKTFELLPRVVRMIRLEPRVPREETHVERAHVVTLTVASPTAHELVPEPGRRPVLDCPRGRRGDRVALVRI